MHTVTVMRQGYVPHTNAIASKLAIIYAYIRNNIRV
jgi:hypothetical protein